MTAAPGAQDNGRQAAHTFLDLLQVLDYGDDSIELAAQRFFESGSVSVDETVERLRELIDSSLS